MTEYIHLIGAEQVQTAANTMREAAQQMGRAVGEMAYPLERHERFMEDWLIRFEAAVERLATRGGNSNE